MRKVADSAAGAVRLARVHAEDAVDLSGEQWIQEARSLRARAERSDDVTAEVARITRRVGWLTRKAARLPKGSNGRTQAEKEAGRLQALAMMLPVAQSGKNVQKLPPFGGAHEQRAIRLVNELAAL